MVHKQKHGYRLKLPFVIVLVCVITLGSQNVGAYSVKKVIETEKFVFTTQESIPVTNHDDLLAATEGVVTEEQPSGDETVLVEATTEFINDDENEISRDKRDIGAVTEKVPFEATANEESETTTNSVPFAAIAEDEEDLRPFVRPVTPDPNADPNYPTINPIPDDFHVNELEDVNVTGPLIEGRAGCRCGVQQQRIVGGQPARIKDYPWTVGLVRGGGRPYCGGTLINSRYVVTASHCVDGQTASRVNVVLNEQDFSSNSESGARPQTVRVEQIIMHQNYNNKNIDQDIALLRLAQSLDLNSMRYTPVCLPSSNANDFAGEKATVAGWGATSQGGSTSSHLRQVTVPVISSRDCNTKTKYNGKITENMLCAGNIRQGGIDSCQGDSGGPLIIENGGRRTLIGIVSWGYGCAQAGSPGVYTRVGRYPEWILANTRGADWCQG